jgi:hypothetical protein
MPATGSTSLDASSMSIISRAKRRFLAAGDDLERLRNGTPALSIVASWRVKKVMSFDALADGERLAATMRMPWRRRLVVRPVDAAFISPRTLVVAVEAFPNVRVFLTSLRGTRRCWWLRWPWCLPLRYVILRGAAVHCWYSISSSEVFPCLTLSKPDWRRLHLLPRLGCNIKNRAISLIICASRR